MKRLRAKGVFWYTKTKFTYKVFDLGSECTKIILKTKGWIWKGILYPTASCSESIIEMLNKGLTEWKEEEYYGIKGSKKWG